MNKINLNIQPIFKTIKIKDKEIKIPRLGLRHHQILKDPGDNEEALKRLMQTIHPNLSVAERDLVSMHLLAFNDRLKSSVVIEGVTYTIDQIEICQKLTFTIGNTEFKFKSPKLDDLNATVPNMLASCCVHVKTDGVKQDIPDFNKLPAFTYKWADDICSTIELNANGKVTKSLFSLMELFDND